MDEILVKMSAMADPHRVQVQKHFGSAPAYALGITMPEIRQLARGNKSHDLALQLWTTGIHEARILASIVDVSSEVTLEQMEAWVIDIDTWDLCDQVCVNLFWRTPYAVACAHNWSHRPEEYVRRAGFVLMAALAIHDKKADDEVFINFFPEILAQAQDPRNFVKKSVNWALRQIGKRNRTLCQAAVNLAQQMRTLDSPSARWIAIDALCELESRLNPEV
jgi:3-methyladenine DNA glycosylase AlkD